MQKSTIKNYFLDPESAIPTARHKAFQNWEEDFMEDLTVRFEVHGDDMPISQQEVDVIYKILGRAP